MIFERVRPWLHFLPLVLVAPLWVHSFQTLNPVEFSPRDLCLGHFSPPCYPCLGAKKCKRILTRQEHSVSEGGGDPMSDAASVEKAETMFASPTIPKRSMRNDNENTLNDMSIKESILAGNKNSTRTKNNNYSTQNKRVEKQPSRNLYEVLGASPSDSKEELKRRYISLVKIAHPDAIAIRGGLSEIDGEERHHDFSEIAQAYKLLSDPKQRRRYDRSLQAEAFSREVQKFASDVTEKAAPQVRDIFDTVAVPFLRRTTATVLASTQAVVKDLSRPKYSDVQNYTSESERRDLGEAFLSAMKAARRAGDIVDNLEMLEKSEGLEQRVLEQIQEATKIKTELETVTMKRLQVSLRTPNATFSSSDAESLIIYWNISDTSRSLFPIGKRSRLDKKIHDLKAIETTFDEKRKELEAALQHARREQQAVQKARADKVLALQAEKRAREALAEAQRRVEDAKTKVNMSTKSLSKAEATVRKRLFEQERLANGVSSHQNDIRRSLMKIEKKVISNESLNEQADFYHLQQREQQLMNEYKAMEVAAARLQANAQGLKERAERLKDVQ